MSTLEAEETLFRKKAEINEPVEAQFSGSTEFILITNHQTTHTHKELEQVENAADGNCCQAWLNGVFRKKTLYKRLPILQWLPTYTRADAIGDLIAGITVGLTVIPQGLAYAGVAGLPTQFGLYGAFMGCFAYVLLGTCKDSTIGSTAIASLLVYQVTQGVWQRAVLLTFITGIIEILMAFFKLAFLVEFVSGPVSAGFTSAVALIVCTSQVKNILGIRNATGTTFLQRWISMIGDFHNVRVADAVLGCSCVAILILFRYIGRLKVGPKKEQKRKWHHLVTNKFLWFLGVSRNATLVIVCAAASSYMEERGMHYFRLTGYIPPGLPEIGLPPFSIDPVPGNATAGVPDVPGESFMEMVNNMGYGIIIVPLVALLENISVCKAFAKGKPIDATQELIAIGVANLANSLCKGYRANGGLARSAVNNASGVRTPLGNLYIGLVVVFALLYLTEFFYYIPKAVLAAIIISAVIFQLQYHVILPMWRSKRSDLIPCFVAFIACLVMPLEIGILVAIGVNLLFILHHSARPKVTLETLETLEGQKFLKLTPDRCLIFPSVEFVRSFILKSGYKTTLPVVIDCTYIYGADYTAAKVISTIIDDFKKRNQKIIFFNLKPDVVQIFEGLHTNLVLCYNSVALNQALNEEDNPNPNPPDDAESGMSGGGAGAGAEADISASNATLAATSNPESQSNASTITLTKL